MLLARICFMAASAGLGCLRAATGVISVKGLFLKLMSCSITAAISGLRLGPQAGLGPTGFTAPAVPGAAAVVAALSEAALVSPETTVAVLSTSVAVGLLLQLLKSRLPTKAGAISQA